MIHGQNTSAMTKHVGVYNDKRCVIVIQLPEAPELVHVIDTDSLPDLYHQNLMEMVNSPEGQGAKWLGEVMSRKMLWDGTNALRTFYERQYISQVPADRVMLSPLPNVTVPFIQVYPNPMAPAPVMNDPLAEMQNPAGVQDQRLAELAAVEQAKLDAHMAQVGQDPTTGYNQHAQNLAGDITGEKAAIGQGLLAEAQMLEAEAASKRAQAAQYGAIANPTPAPVRSTELFVDPMTGKSYKTAGALKGVQTKRANASK